ncbi:MAG: tetratricopeptide repeat protein [Terracidiphilus sp.]|jgi:tetratricopeptide (TPR) repeat protein
MMTRKLLLLPVRFTFAVAAALLLHSGFACAQGASGSPAQASPAPAPALAATPIQVAPAETEAADTAKTPNRAQAYYHLALANTYEEEAVNQGRPELVNKAIEEYKYALNADPTSPQLNNALADLYFRSGHTREAESSARSLLKNLPDNIEAHRLLGRIYLRALSEGKNAPSSSSSGGDALDQAIAEFEKIVVLEPTSVEERLVLGQLYHVKHDDKKAEEQFKTALTLDPDTEDVVLNLARLYAEKNDIDSEARVIESVPVDHRSSKMEDTLGAAYEQLKRTKDAIAAFQRAVDMEPGDAATLEALGKALLDDNQLDEALKQFKALADADPENAEALIHISEVQRRQGKYEDALATIRKARKMAPDDLDAGYNEGLLLDVLGRFEDATQVYEQMVDLTSHANGAYTTDEKNNRGIFLERLGGIYHEQNKTPEAIAAYQKMIDMGGDAAIRGYQSQADTYRDARQYDKAVEVARKAVEANPKDRDLKLMLAGELGDLGKTDDGLAMARGLLANNNDDRPIWLAIGQMNLRAHRWKDAEDSFNKAEPMTTKREDRTYLFFLRGELAERQKHTEQAEIFFRQVLDLEPDSSMTLNYLGYMLADKGIRLPEALDMIRKAVKAEPMNGAYLDSLGWVYFKMGDNEQAEEYLRQAVARDQTDPTVHDHLGDVYEKTGRIRLAAAQWQLSLAQFAKSVQVDIEPAELAKVQKKLETARIKLAKQENATGQTKPE